LLGFCTLFRAPVCRREKMLMVCANGKLMKPSDSRGSRRADSGWQGESVTRGDRRRRELEVRETVSAARLPARIDGAGGILDLRGGVQHRALFIGQYRIVVLFC
jgi:hypothetical protein